MVQIGRPPVFTRPNGELIYLPVHAAFEASRNKRQIFVAHRRGWKTSMALAKVFKYLWSNPGIMGKTLAPIRKQGKEIIWDDPDMLFHPNVCPREIMAGPPNKSNLSIQLKNGSIWSLDGADNPQAKRGGNVKVLHLTEAGDHKEAIWTQVYEPVMIANGGIAIFEGNPRAQNWYYRLFESAPSRGWDRFLVSARDTPIFSPEELADLEANTPSAVFRAEYGCEWIASAGTVFLTFQDIATEEPCEALPHRKYRAGLDLGKVNDFTVNSIVDRHTWHQVYLNRFNNLNWNEIKAKLKDDFKAYSRKDQKNELEIMVEINGPGGPIFDDLVRWAQEDEIRKNHSLSFVPFTTTWESKAALVSSFSILSDQGLIRILDNPLLKAEFSDFIYSKISTGLHYSAPPDKHDDIVIGTLLSFWQLGPQLLIPDLSPPKETYWGIPRARLDKMRRVSSNPFSDLVI